MSEYTYEALKQYGAKSWKPTRKVPLNILSPKADIRERIEHVR
jgi:hypothetical protein